jgi:2-keto-4-pentenoate hydratase/2-oxohepta-3-ene-1,7-dioic acid hydratase in catechol pathway
MKLLRFGEPGAEKPGFLDDDGNIRDLTGHTSDFAGETVSLKALDGLRRLNLSAMPIVQTNERIGSCVASTPTFHCIGLNYTQHAKETGAEPPKEPIIFTKAASALCGPYENVIRPKGSTKLDYEVELGIVIGQSAEYVSEAEALSYVAGYTLVNDVSEREYQIERGGQWVKGKSFRNFAPTGPWLVTADEIPDPQSLNCWLEVNGEKRQNSSTSDMIFGVAEIISYMSRFMRLVPGDIIATGTPQGVAMGMKPPAWLKPGDEIRLGIEGLGEQKQTVVDYEA